MAKVEIKNLSILKEMAMVQQVLLQQMIKELMADVLVEIIRLTNKGLNAYAQPFQPYSKYTISKKRKDNKSTIPNMQDTSSMINSLNMKPLKRSKYIRYRISVSGSFKGVSNKSKLASLDKHKNYIILEWTNHYMNLIGKHEKIFQERCAQKMSNL